MKMDHGSSAVRMASGVPGCDAMLGGGFIQGHTYLLAGSAGTGKTIFGLQFLQEGAGRGERALYVTLAESSAEIRQNARTMSLVLDGVDFVDLAPSGNALTAESGEYHVFSPSEVEKDPLWMSICAEVAARRPQRVVVDSLTQLRFVSTDEYQFRKNVLALVNFLNAQGCTSLITYEPDELLRETSAGLAVNGIIRMRSEVSVGLAIGLRSIQVEKMRGSDFIAGRHALRISASGHEVFPHVIEQAGGADIAAHCFSTGIEELDALLEGGIESGTTTLLSGPAGTGKTTLGTHFMVRQAPGRGVIFTCEESPSLLIRRARTTGAPIDAAVASGSLRVERINPLERYPDEFLAMVRRAVEVEERSFVMIDSLRGYTLGMQEFGDAQAHIHNLVNYLSRKSVTTLLVSEVENITGPLTATDVGVSHLADNILLLRYAEDAGRVMKIVGCLKKRAGNFEPELRELRITNAGIRVSGKLHHLRGVLTGVPGIGDLGTTP